MGLLLEQPVYICAVIVLHLGVIFYWIFRMMEAASDEACLPVMRDLCLQLLANVTRVQVNARLACVPM